MTSNMTNGSSRKRLVREGFSSQIPTKMADVFSSPPSPDYLSHPLHSPTDSSEDSVEVKVSPISLRNKRKCAEPRKVQDIFSGPLKKRVCLQVRKTEEAILREQREKLPFRPWSVGENKKDEEEVKPVALVLKREAEEELRVPLHPAAGEDAERLLVKSAETFPSLQKSESSKSSKDHNNQRNYKNMTRERRIEANARERTRVHTISAAFETLRRSVPSYSHNQKLSKLSVLRIACSYIMTLSSLVAEDGEAGPTPAECVENVSRTIQREGKLRKKKDESD